MLTETPHIFTDGITCFNIALYHIDSKMEKIANLVLG